MVAAFTFREATVDDVDAIVALVESAYRGEASKAGWTTEADLLEGQRTDRESVRTIVESLNAHAVLAFDASSNQLLACCQLESRGNAAYFGMFAVQPALQGSGVGKALLAEAERRARDDWSADHLEMTVIAQREDLIAWYLRHGYRKTGENRPFPYGDERFGLPLRDDLEFCVLSKPFS
jgi:ribosomal protein S18 acetylase RimI-like enzyme